MPIPGAYDIELDELRTLASVIHSKVDNLRYGRMRSTTRGYVRVPGRKLDREIADIRALLEEHGNRCLALAHSADEAGDAA
jgi:hypothetical protein